MCTQCVCNFLSLVSRESDVHASEDVLIAFSPLCVCNFLALVADESGGWTMCFVFVYVQFLVVAVWLGVVWLKRETRL